MGLANNYYVVLIAYVFIGILYCSDNVNTTTVLTDFTPLSKRWIVPLLGMAWTIGSTLVSLYVLILSTYNLSAIMIYRLFCVFTGVFHVVSLILRLLSDESPRFLLGIGKIKKAEAVL